MITMNFTLGFTALIPDNLFNISKLVIVDSASYRAVDTTVKTNNFGLGYGISPSSSSTSLFNARYGIKNVYNEKLFVLPYVLNKEERVRTFHFSAKSKLETVVPETRIFILKSKITVTTNNLLYEFSGPFKNESANLATFNFNSKFGLEKNFLNHRVFNIPFVLFAGGNKNGLITVNSTTGSVSNVSYRIDGVSANIGDVVDILANEILVPKIIYVVINNGANSLLRTGRFELRENNKLLELTDNGITLSLEVDKIKIDFSADTTTPVSVKIIRGTV